MVGFTRCQKDPNMVRARGDANRQIKVHALPLAFR